MRCSACPREAVEGRVRCVKCATRARKHSVEYRRKHPEKTRASKEKHKAKHLDQIRDWDIWYRKMKRYGMTKESYESMAASQGGVCAICSRACQTGRRLAVDHCHDTGKIRGLLCANCNTGLGKFSDSEDLMLLAIDYIRRTA